MGDGGVQAADDAINATSDLSLSYVGAGRVVGLSPYGTWVPWRPGTAARSSTSTGTSGVGRLEGSVRRHTAAGSLRPRRRRQSPPPRSVASFSIRSSGINDLSSARREGDDSSRKSTSTGPALSPGRRPTGEGRSLEAENLTTNPVCGRIEQLSKVRSKSERKKLRPSARTETSLKTPYDPHPTPLRISETPRTPADSTGRFARWKSQVRIPPRPILVRCRSLTPRKMRRTR